MKLSFLIIAMKIINGPSVLSEIIEKKKISLIQPFSTAGENAPLLRLIISLICLIEHTHNIQCILETFIV